MLRHEFLQQFDAIGRNHAVKIIQSNGGEYVARWPDVKIHARHVKLPDATAPAAIRVPYDEIKGVTKYSG